MFPQSLKLADITPVYKKSDRNLVLNYRPISALPTMSKVFERLMHHQVSQYIDKHLLPFLWLEKGIQYSNCTSVAPGKMEKYIR